MADFSHSLILHHACDAIQRISAAAPKRGHETGANTIPFMGFWDCTFGDDVYPHI